MDERMDRAEKEDKGLIKKWDRGWLMEALPEVSEHRELCVNMRQRS